MSRNTLMIIDDDTMVLSSLSGLLESEGYKVEPFDNAGKALASLDRIRPDLIILDVKMPGMSGLGFLKEISDDAGKPRYPVLILTAWGNMGGFFENLDISGFLIKPCPPDQLLADIARILSAARPPAGVEEPRKAKGGPRKILIVEDDQKSSDELTVSFEAAGFKVEKVNNGSDAIGMAIMSPPDVMLVKEVLSQMNGHLAASMLKSVPKTKDLPVILYDSTGSITPAIKAQLQTVGIDKIVFSSKAKDLLDAANELIR